MHIVKHVEANLFKIWGFHFIFFLHFIYHN